jgi:hypothetical protein
MADFTIRRAGEADSEEILAVLKVVTAERIYTAIDRPEALEQERIYLRSLSLREATDIAVAESGEVIGFQNWIVLLVRIPLLSQEGWPEGPGWFRSEPCKDATLEPPAFSRCRIPLRDPAAHRSQEGNSSLQKARRLMATTDTGIHFTRPKIASGRI